MADVKISALPTAGSLTGAEIVPIVQSGVTKRTTAAAILSQTATNAFVQNLIAGQQVIVRDASINSGIILDGATHAIFVASITDALSNAKLSSTGTGGTAQAQAILGGSLQVTLGFAANGNTPQTKATVNAAASDPATTQALVNQLRAALIANGICV